MRLPSIGTRLARVLLASALLWSLAVSAAVWLAVRHEVGELLDDALRESALMLAWLPGDSQQRPTARPSGRPPPRFVWQILALRDGSARVIRASPRAPDEPLLAVPGSGFADIAGWRVYGLALAADATMLVVAQSRAERVEAMAETALRAAGATLAIALLAYLWLRARATRELAPLARLSQRLEEHDLLAPGATLGPAERAELAPVHRAIDALASQLARRLGNERAFTAHAAHALRTPLAGIDAQLALALRDAPPTLAPRLQQARAAAGRLQRVVATLLALFRSGLELQRQPLDLAALLERLPTDGLAITVTPGPPIEADADLLAAVLSNLLDNAIRHGARQITLGTAAPSTLRIVDDGPGVPPQRLAALRHAIEAQTEVDERVGLGLRLADMVARAHGGALRLPDATRGFAIELQLAPSAAPRERP